MGTEIAGTVTNDPAARSKAVVSFASSTAWDLRSAVAMAESVDLPRLVAGYERGLVPLAEEEPRGMSLRDPTKPGKLTTALGDALAMIATKINPTMSVEQSDAWIKIVVSALSDLPGRVAKEAAEAALRRSTRFFGEVDGVVREEAEKILAWRRTALARLRAMRAEIERAASPPPALPAPEPLGPMSAEEIRRLTPALRSLGLSAGWITQDEIDAALAGDGEQAEAA